MTSERRKILDTLMFAVLFTVLAFVSVGCAAETYTVCASGCDYSSIQAAINAAQPGDTIEVYSGTYYENVNVNKELILRGIDTGGGKPVVDAGGIGSAITLSHDGTVLDGFTAINAGSYPQAGILVHSNNNIIINCTASNNSYDGIILIDSSTNTLTGNTVSSNDYGIRLYYASNNYIYNNYFDNTINAKDDGNNIWNVSKTVGENIVGGSWLGGNYWSDYAGEDTNGDGLGDSMLPHNSSGYITNGGDWLPLVKAEEQPPAQFTDVYTDYGEDTDGDGLYDYLVIDVGVNVREADDYYVCGKLYINNVSHVDFAHNTTYLNEGTKVAKLRFSGPRIRDTEYNGSFDLKLLFLNPPSLPTLYLFAYPTEIIADGASTATITAMVWDGEYWIWFAGFNVNFSTDLGTITPSAPLSDGEAKATLTAGTMAGTATVTAEVNLSCCDIGLLTNTTTVTFTPSGDGGGGGGGGGGGAGGTTTPTLTSGLKTRREEVWNKTLTLRPSEPPSPPSDQLVDFRYYAYKTSSHNYTDFQEHIFNTGASKNPYPSISGTLNGTITPFYDINVSKMYTYPCIGTGGHTEYVKIWNSKTGWNVTATWNGYTGDWHNLSFDKNFTLEAGETYNYIIQTGSYPQIHHKPELQTANGWITCTEFVDVNGKRHEDWIPAIWLWNE